MERSIKVLHVIRSIDPDTGGPAFAVMQMSSSIAGDRVHVDIATTHAVDEGADKYSSRVPVVGSALRLFSFSRALGGNWCFSVELWRWLKANIRDYDLVHITGVFTFPVIIAAILARRAGIPYIVRPAGTLDAYPLTKKAWRKKIFYRLLLKRLLEHAAIIHATSAAEQNQIKLLDARFMSTVIPLAVALHNFNRIHTDSDQVRLLFLSRIHPKKGLPVLLRALAILNNRNKKYSLTIAGAGSQEYLNELRYITKELGIVSLVSYTGFVDGEDKDYLLRNSDVFVLPSYQENFGIAVVEAMAVGLPVVVSDQVAISAKILKAGAGKVVPIDEPGQLAEVICALESSDTRNALGQAGIELVRSNFSPEALRQGLHSMYSEVLEK